MAQASLRVVEKDRVGGKTEIGDRKRALEAALPDRPRVRQGLGDEARPARSRGRDRRRFPPARWASTSRSASAGCRAAASSRFTGRNRPARRRSRCMSWPRRRKRAASRPISMRNMRSIPVYASKLGVDIDEMLISQPDTGEQALEITDTLVRSGGVDIVVIDSVAALTPKAELEGEMGDQLPGLQARLMSQALRKLTGSISKSNCLVIFINQIRMKIGVMFGNPETTTGGNALKFYASVRLDIRRIGAIKDKRRSGRQPDAREGGEEQGRAALQAGRIRHHVRRRASPRPASCSISASRPASWRSRARGSPMTASASARAAKTPSASSQQNKDVAEKIEAADPRRMPGSSARPWC